MSKPAIGRIVHFRLPVGQTDNGAKVLPAIITRVFGDDLVNLTVFSDSSEPFRATSVHLGDAEQPRSWFWPLRDGV